MFGFCCENSGLGSGFCKHACRIAAVVLIAVCAFAFNKGTGYAAGQNVLTQLGAGLACYTEESLSYEEYYVAVFEKSASEIMS